MIRSAALLFAVVSEIVFRYPCFAGITGLLAELAHMVGIKLNELKMSPDRRAVRALAVSVITHYSIFQLSFKVDAVGLAINLVLYPYLPGAIVMVKAFAAAAIAAAPVFQQHALVNELNAAGSCRTMSLRGDHVPITKPEIKLPVLGMMCNL